ncbi:hypothetical protein GCM10025787_19200 [Saccharopolyspora rosea]
MLSVFVAAVWVVLGVTNGWPVWGWLVLALVSLVAPSLVVLGITEWNLRRGGPRTPEQQEEIVPETPPREQPEPRSHPVQDVLLRSASEDYQFTFSCTVFWRPRPDAPGLPHANPEALAADAVLDEAAALAAAVRPGDASRARYRLTSALGVPRADRSGRVEAWADEVSLVLSDRDAARLTRLAEVRKDEEVWEYERAHERNVRAYLSEEVLTNPGSALVWWLAGPRTEEKERVDEAVARIESLRRLTEAAAGAESGAPRFAGLAHETFPVADGNRTLAALPYVVAPPPGSGGQALEEHALGLVAALPEGPERALFARRLADLVAAQGHDDVAEDIRRSFDTAEPATDTRRSFDTAEPAEEDAVPEPPEDATGR